MLSHAHTQENRHTHTHTFRHYGFEMTQLNPAEGRIVECHRGKRGLQAKISKRTVVVECLHGQKKTKKSGGWDEKDNHGTYLTDRERECMSAKSKKQEARGCDVN